MLSDLKQTLPLILPDDKKLSFVRTGSKIIDSICSGIPRKHISVITGSSGCGKSMILMNMAILMANENKDMNIAYLSIENDLSVDASRSEDIMNYYNIYNISNLHYYNFSEYSNSEVMEFLHSVAIGVNGEYQIIIIDGTELIVSDQPEKMHEEGEKFQQKLKEYTIDFNITFILSWQNSKNALMKKFKEITLADMSGSSALATRAALVIAVGYEYDKDNKRQNMIRCLKTRCGASVDAFVPKNIGCWNNPFYLLEEVKSDIWDGIK